MLKHPILLSGASASPSQGARELIDGEMCIGDMNTRWDVSFAERLLLGVRKLLSRKSSLPMNHPAIFTPAESGLRKAA